MVLTRLLAVLVLSLLLSGCGPIESVRADVSTPSAAISGKREIRATGTIQAVRALTVQVPQVSGLAGAQNNGRLTLVRLVPNGTRVKQGDMLAEFDRTAQLDAALEAKAKYEDLGHQVREKEAKNNSDAAKRSAEISQAQADLDKAAI